MDAGRQHPPDDLELRYARAEEFAEVCALDGASFGFHYDETDRADAALDIDPQRVLAARAGGRLVGISAELPFAMSVPGGADVPVTGLTWVSVDVTRRRQGVLTALSRRQITARAEAGDAALVLTAAEGGIYRRYGFGVASRKRHSVVERRRARLARPVDAGEVRLLDTDSASDALPALYERRRALVPGMLARDDRRWSYQLLDRPGQRDGRSGLFHLLHPDGYLSYRVRADWGEGDPHHQVWITDYAPVTPQAHAALWQTLLGMDLVGTVESYQVPLDDPLELMLTDPRGTGTSHLGDDLWVRPLDPAALLAARTYATDIDCVLEVRDAVLGDARFHLVGDPVSAMCARSERLPQLHLDVADLGAICLGGTRLARVAQAGLAGAGHGIDPATTRRWDAAFRAEREPAVGTRF